MPNANQCQSMRIEILGIGSKLISIGMNTVILIGIDWHWTMIEGVLTIKLP